MAQLRQDYALFTQRNVAVIAVGPESVYKFKTYWDENDLPFIGLADPEQTAARRYEQEINLFKLGRMPAQIIIDKGGIVRYAHYSNSMSDIPHNEEILAVIDEIAGES
ncbi:redoxin domain-containing protein [Chloroflexota bacterium]|nr:redoxin domain-containing protein [Chloroflexota bacterium]